MSEADKMFEELGYKKQWVEDESEVELWKKELFGGDFIELAFDKTHELLNIRTENTQEHRTITSILTMQTLKAINKKCEELGWM